MGSPDQNIVPGTHAFSDTQCRPRWFISRGDGAFTPLIAADELPLGLKLVGVSREIAIEHANGMQCLGEVEFTGRYILDSSAGMWSPISSAQSPPTSPPKSYHTPDPAARQMTEAKAMELTISGSDGWNLQKHGKVMNVSNNDHNPSSEVTQNLIDAIASSNPQAPSKIGYQSYRPIPPSGVLPDLNKKEYCTYWIRTGSCDYTQQGCLYKHEMPDRETLRKIGINGTPRWYTERTAMKLKSSISGPSSAQDRSVPAWMQLRLKAENQRVGPNGLHETMKPSLVFEPDSSSDSEGPPQFRNGMIIGSSTKKKLQQNIPFQTGRHDLKNSNTINSVIPVPKSSGLFRPQGNDLIDLSSLASSTSPKWNTNKRPPTVQGNAQDPSSNKLPSKDRSMAIGPDSQPMFSRGIFVPTRDKLHTQSRETTSPPRTNVSPIGTNIVDSKYPSQISSSQKRHRTKTASDIYALIRTGSQQCSHDKLPSAPTTPAPTKVDIPSSKAPQSLALAIAPKTPNVDNDNRPPRYKVTVGGKFLENIHQMPPQDIMSTRSGKIRGIDVNKSESVGKHDNHCELLSSATPTTVSSTSL